MKNYIVNREDTAVIVGPVPVFHGKHDITALITDEVFIIRRDQEKLVFSEATCAAIVSQIELPSFIFLDMKIIAQE